MFQVRAEKLAKHMLEELTVVFHYEVEQLLFPSQRAHHNIQLPTSCLTQRVKKPHRDGWGNIKGVIEYLIGIKQMELTPEVSTVGMLNWLIDASR